MKHVKKHISANEELLQWIYDVVSLLKSDEYDLQTRIFWIINDISKFPTCDNETCGKEIKRNVNLYCGYVAASGHTYCCHKCSVSSEFNKQQHKQTRITRYGVESYTQTDECKKKIQETSMERYGTTNPGCSEQALAKIE